MAAAYQPPVSDESGLLVIRPSWKSLGRWEFHIVVIVGAVVVLVLARFGFHQTSNIVFLSYFGVFFAAYALYLTLYMLGTRITVTSDSILVTHWFGSTAAVQISDIAQVIRCSIDESRGQSSGWPRPAVFALSPSGKCVLSLWAERWNQADLDRIWRHLGMPTDTWGTIKKSDLRERFPGAF